MKQTMQRCYITNNIVQGVDGVIGTVDVGVIMAAFGT